MTLKYHILSQPIGAASLRSRGPRPGNFVQPPKVTDRSQCRSKSKDDEYLTCPIVIEIAEKLTQSEYMPSPLWSSWCGAIGGLWVGHRAVYAPFTGKPEPIALDGKEKVYYVSQCCVEERTLNAEGQDCTVRHEARAVNGDKLEQYICDASNLDFSRGKDGDLDWDTDTMVEGEKGLFIFDGGSYSRGPLRLCEVPGEAEVPDDVYNPMDNVQMIESCLQWNGEQRIRISITISCDLLEADHGPDPELDVSLLRVAVSREDWEGVPGKYTSSSQSEQDAQGMIDSGEARILKKEMSGFWNQFEMDVSLGMYTFVFA